MKLVLGPLPGHTPVLAKNKNIFFHNHSNTIAPTKFDTDIIFYFLM